MNCHSGEVSFHKDIVPVLRRNCQGCHRPGKSKGDFDVSSFAAFQKGGKHGASFKPGDMKSLVLEQIRGDKPKMPEDGDALSPTDVALIEKWIKQGAKDDTPAATVIKEPPVYKVPPVISALAWSPDGSTLAVSGYHEVLLHKPDGSGIAARLLCESPRIESLAWSLDGKLLAASGGAPAQFGQILVWEAATQKLAASYKITLDSLYGVSFSPDNERLAFGCADKTVRMIALKDGKELLRLDNHADWVLGTTFTVDGKRVLSGSRDRAMKLINAADGQLIDDINKLLEPILCIARDPKQDQVAYGGALGTPRIYKIADNQNRTAANNDTNLVKEIERQPWPVRAIAYSPDGGALAVGGIGSEVRIYSAKDGKRLATLAGNGAAVFSVAFSPDGKLLAAGGFDGTVRIFDTATGKLDKSFVPVPIQTASTTTREPLAQQ